MDQTPEAPAQAKAWDFDWLPIYFVSLLLIAFLLIIAGVGQQLRSETVPGPGEGAPPAAPAAPRVEVPGLTSLGPVAGNDLPGGTARIFSDDRLLVSYYGTAGTSSLGVLGQGSPAEVWPELLETAGAFAATGRPVQPVLELVVTVAHAGPTGSGQYSSDIDRAEVQRYIDAAHEYGALLVLALQPGRATFTEVARRWEWALRDPLVGLALDTEWRMSRGGVPGEQIGSVGAAEVNEVSAWLEDLTVSRGLPEKLFVIHQFSDDMVREPAQVLLRPHLATVQHLDGVGTPRAKLDELAAIGEPSRFALGLTLFREEDVPLMSPSEVLRIRPQVSVVGYR